MNGYNKKSELYRVLARGEGMMIRLLPVYPADKRQACYANKIAIVLKVAYKVPKNLDANSKFFLGVYDYTNDTVAIQILIEEKILWGEVSKRTFQIL